jgi:hypothetical protein
MVPARTVVGGRTFRRRVGYQSTIAGLDAGKTTRNRTLHSSQRKYIVAARVENDEP